MSNNERVLKEIKRLGYKMDENGVLTNPKGKEVKGHIGSAGYRQAGLRVLEFQSYKLMFHRIQAFKKYGDEMFKKGVMVRHKDNNKLNNSEENVLIGTQSQNMMDIPKNKRVSMSKSPFKHKHGEVFELHQKGLNNKEIALKLGMSSGLVSWILNKSAKAKELK